MKNCFAMMPFGGYFDGYWKDVIRPTLELAGVEPTRADEIYSAGAIIDDIYAAIMRSDICIADVTGKNPNVSYELGMAHAARKPTILITQQIADVPFDYRHLRHIVYNPMQSGWERGFKESLTKTIRAIIESPANSLALKTLADNDSARDINVMRAHLSNIFYIQGYDLDRENDIFIGGSEGCMIVTSWRGVARSRLHHLCHNVVCDMACVVDVKRAYDVLNARELECITFDESSKHRTYFMLLKQHKESGQPFHIETEVAAPGYLNVDLLASRNGAILSTQAVAGDIRYIRKIDRLHFPKEHKFSRLQAEIVSHPRRERIGSVINTVECGEHYILEIDYDADVPYQQETGCRLRIL